jgi:hypothetical protein
MKINLALLCLLFVALSTEPSVAQADRISHQDYLEAIGMGDDYIVMSNILVRGLQLKEPGNTAEYYINNASFFSMILLLSKVKPRDYYRLEEKGVDVLNAITADTRPFSEQSLLADLVLTGRVTNIETNTPANDGFDVSVSILVDEVLKGDVPVDTITIRQRNLDRISDSQTRPENGRSYLFLLSSGVYGYQKANYQYARTGEAEAGIPDFGNEDTFVIYRMYHKSGNTIAGPGRNISQIREELIPVINIIE